MELAKEFKFEASHILTRHKGKCSQLHGHSWVLTVTVSGPVNPETGFVLDYIDIKAIVQPIVDELDHKHLGDWTAKLFMSPDGTDYAPLEKHCVHGMPFDFYPSSENLIVWIADNIEHNLDVVITNFKRINDPTPIQLDEYKVIWSQLELKETDTSSCILTREEYDKIFRPGH